jgi:hypothetical protein
VAFEVDENIQYNKTLNKEKAKELENRENSLKRVEVMLQQREVYLIEEEERRKKEEEEEKFDIAALLAKVKLTKVKGGFGFNTKHHYSTVSKIDNAKRQI